MECPAAGEAAGYSFDPAALDLAFQALLCIRVIGEEQNGASGVLEVPDRIGSIRVLGRPGRRMLVWARVRDTGLGNCGELRIFDDSHRLVAHVTGRFPRGLWNRWEVRGPPRLDRCLYETEWRVVESGAVPIPVWTINSQQNAAWVILSDGGEAGDRLARRLAELGADRVVSASFQTGPATRRHYEEILAGEASLSGVIHIGNLDAPLLPDTANATGRVADCDSLLSVARILSRRADSKLWVITKGAHHLRPADLPADPFPGSLVGSGPSNSTRNAGSLGRAHRLIPQLPSQRDRGRSRCDSAARRRRSVRLSRAETASFRGFAG